LIGMIGRRRLYRRPDQQVEERLMEAGLPTSGAALFWELVEPMYADPAVQRSTMTGLPCVRLYGRFFASLDRRTGALLVKLPAQRVAQLVTAGYGEPFAPAGRVFREWVGAPGSSPCRRRRRGTASPRVAANTSGMDERGSRLDAETRSSRWTVAHQSSSGIRFAAITTLTTDPPAIFPVRLHRRERSGGDVRNVVSVPRPVEPPVRYDVLTLRPAGGSPAGRCGAPV
jgi:hypothetical protein